MNQGALAELMASMESGLDSQADLGAPQFHARYSWEAAALTLNDLNELNIHFNRRYPHYAITVIGSNGQMVDQNDKHGSVVVLVAHQVIRKDLPDVFSAMYHAAMKKRADL